MASSASIPPPLTTTLTSLPPELFMAIFSYLPHRTTKTVISPLHSTTRFSPSKSALQNLSFSTSTLRAVCAPYIFEALHIKSPSKLQELVESQLLTNIGRYVKRITIRWDGVGAVVKRNNQDVPIPLEDEKIKEHVGVIIKFMPGLKSITFDFPGAVTALEYALAHGGVVESLETVSVRNGRYEYHGGMAGLFTGLGKLKGLKSVVVDGVFCGDYTLKSERPLGLDTGAFGRLVNLDLGNISSLDDGILHEVVSAAKGDLKALRIKSCEGVTLAGMRRLLMEFGANLQSLVLEIIKKKTCQDCNHNHEEEYELHEFQEEEHLCPVIRDYCGDLKMLDLYTNKICKEILFSSGSGSGAMTGGLPTPPGSPELAPTRLIDIHTPPVDSVPGEETVGAETMLPPPLIAFKPGNFEKRREVNVVKREKMKRVALRIPYDSSCFGAGAKGPSLQQVHTTLCDGSLARDLLEIGTRAYEDGLVGLVNVTGHWKGGPRLIMDD
ncbi:hypothetical protein TWF694_003490 [Orbilia ellipsospora]|uniref:F-box domain-containing protein n=1 Tax=Orbilia ellipsospora TaxID=2528407 RepID=A0AAV9WZI4_9PEZI